MGRLERSSACPQQTMKEFRSLVVLSYKTPFLKVKVNLFFYYYTFFPGNGLIRRIARCHLITKILKHLCFHLIGKKNDKMHLAYFLLIYQDTR